MISLRNRWASLSPLGQDAVLATLLTAFTQYEIWIGRSEVAGTLAAQQAAFFTMTAAVVMRRRYALMSVVVVAAGLAVQTVLGEAPVVGGFLAMIIATHSVASYASGRRAILGLVAMLAAVEVYPIIHPTDIQLADEIGNAVIFILIWGLARTVRNRQELAESLESRAVILERQQEANKQEAVARERTRIARELHDIVAHSVSIMLLQAGGARKVLGAEHRQVSESLLNVEKLGRQALEEMHRLLGILRQDQPVLSEQPPGALEQIPDLLGQMGAAGLAVHLSVEGDPSPIPQSVELSAYRIIQESLTNALKHSSSLSAWVTLRYADAGLELEVTDSGEPARATRGRGYGLAGMQERANLFGGTLSAGPSGNGGWQVKATLPISSIEP